MASASKNTRKKARQRHVARYHYPYLGTGEDTRELSEAIRLSRRLKPATPEIVYFDPTFTSMNPRTNRQFKTIARRSKWSDGWEMKGKGYRAFVEPIGERERVESALIEKGMTARQASNLAARISPLTVPMAGAPIYDTRRPVPMLPPPRLDDEQREYNEGGGPKRGQFSFDGLAPTYVTRNTSIPVRAERHPHSSPHHHVGPCDAECRAGRRIHAHRQFRR